MNWVKAPIPIYLVFYMFNWTNPDDVRSSNVKPHFQEMGPYVFLERHVKEQIEFHENGTVSYFQRRTWFFDAEKSNGTLDDSLTMAHVITAVKRLTRGADRHSIIDHWSFQYFSFFLLLLLSIFPINSIVTP